MSDDSMKTRFDADTCERIFYAALKEGDIKGVEAALRVMAPQDPQRAQRLLDSLRDALAIRNGAGSCGHPPQESMGKGVPVG